MLCFLTLLSKDRKEIIRDRVQPENESALSPNFQSSRVVMFVGRSLGKCAC